MEDHSNEILSILHEIRDFVRLMAEPAIAVRDKKLRDGLQRIVGSSKPKGRATLLMNGSRVQADIGRESGMQSGHLSTLVRQLAESKLLSGEGKRPRLTVSVPANFFDSEVADN